MNVKKVKLLLLRKLCGIFLKNFKNLVFDILQLIKNNNNKQNK